MFWADIDTEQQITQKRKRCLSFIYYLFKSSLRKDEKKQRKVSEITVHLTTKTDHSTSICMIYQYFMLTLHCHYQMRTKHGASAEAVDEIGANSLLVG